MSYLGKNVWITGASSGIGAALAHELAKSGVRLILSARNQNKLSHVISNCVNSSDHCIVPLDLSQADACFDTVGELLPSIGPVDTIINCAGVSQRSLVKDTPLDIDRQIMEINFFGTVAMTKALLPSMLQRQSGHIVAISSLVGKYGTQLRSAYSASKHALHGFMESLRAETSGDGIKVTIICPGFVKTDASVNALTEDGTPHGIIDAGQAGGISPEKCARQIRIAIEQGKSEVYIGGKEIYTVYLKRLFPGRFSRLIRNAKVT